MEEEKKYTIEEANHYFGIEFNNAIWTLLDKKDRTEAENHEMINLAHASLLHWSRSPKGTKANLQRGEYMIANVHTFIGNKDQALYYANRCLKLTQDYKSEMADFDIAYAYLIMARALALAGNKEEGLKYLDLAKKATEEIKDKDDKDIVLLDLDAEPWYSLKN